MEWALDVCTRVCTLCLAVRPSGRKGNTPMWGSRAGGAGILRWCPPASGTLAWADRYGPVWRTGTRYNAAEASPPPSWHHKPSRWGLASRPSPYIYYIGPNGTILVPTSPHLRT